MVFPHTCWRYRRHRHGPGLLENQCLDTLNTLTPQPNAKNAVSDTEAEEGDGCGQQFAALGLMPARGRGCSMQVSDKIDVDESNGTLLFLYWWCMGIIALA